MSDFINISSISQLHQMFGLAKPVHPLIAIIRKWPKTDFNFSNIKLTSDLYLISMKGKLNGNSFQYGKNTYDFEEGTLVSIAPNQVVSFDSSLDESAGTGWSIFFHPDLILKSELGRTINHYNFFNYDINEALHLSEKEKISLVELVDKIEVEIHQNTDKYSQDLIVQNLETILKYSNRYYDRQFYTRTNLNKDFATKFEAFLKMYFSSNEIVTKGIPTIKQCGEVLNMSGSYLSDLLKLETGKSAKDHIHSFLINKAKNSLLNSQDSVGQIAFNLGFQYPQHFSKLFKSKTGNTPSEYRTLN